MDHLSDSGAESCSKSEFSISSSEKEEDADAIAGVEACSFSKENEPAYGSSASGENVISEDTKFSENCDPAKSHSPTKEKLVILEGDGNPHFEPETGMVFHSEDDAFEFYNTYAKRTGFSVRKGHLSKRKDGSVRVRIFLCSNEGLRQKNGSANRKPRYNERTDCKARIEFKVDRDNVWIVKKVALEHNHPLLSQDQSYKLRSHRKIWCSQPFTVLAEEETRNAEVYDKRTREIGNGDAHVLLDFLKENQAEDPAFFYAVQLDEKGQLTCFLWADGHSIADYSYFGDVVLLDTTYRISKFGIPFTPFIGVNHHKQPILFAGAILLDESLESFIWLFRTFMTAMSARQPKSIFTEQHDTLSEAIRETMPDVCHRLCLWHIVRSSVKHLSQVYYKDPNSQKEFKECVYNSISRKDFDSEWSKLIDKYDLSNNLWLQELYTSREQWALPYQGKSFCATMLTMQWCDSVDNIFRKYIDRKLPISKFLERYQKALPRFREKELFEDFKSRQNKSALFSNISMLDEAAGSYTRLMYTDFEDEIRNQFACLCEPVGIDGATYTFKVSFPKHNTAGLVEFDPSNVLVTCSCQKFEHMGILCMHILKVLSNNNVLHLPSQYVLRRWTKFAKDGFLPCAQPTVVESNFQASLKQHYSSVCHKAISIAVKSSVSSDALVLFEHGLDKLSMEVDNLLHNSSLAIERGMQKNRLKGLSEKKRRKILVNVSNNVGNSHVPSHIEGKIDDPSFPIMINGPSSIPSYPQDNVGSFYNAIALQPNGVSGFTSYPPETVMPTQELFTTSQGIYDPPLASQQVTNSSIARGNGAVSVGVHVPVVQAQTNSFNNWGVQHFGVDVLASQHHLDQPLHSTITNQQQQLPGKLNLDINKGN